MLQNEELLILCAQIVNVSRTVEHYYSSVSRADALALD